MVQISSTQILPYKDCLQEDGTPINMRLTYRTMLLIITLGSDWILVVNNLNKDKSETTDTHSLPVNGII
jgi:hypothetical protein